MRDKVYSYVVIRMGFSSEATFYVCPVESGAVGAAVDLARLEKDDFHSFYVMKMPCGEILPYNRLGEWPKYEAVKRIWRKGKRVYVTKKIDRDFS